jgi:hypothetical protein
VDESNNLEARMFKKRGIYKGIVFLCLRNECAKHITVSGDKERS